MDKLGIIGVIDSLGIAPERRGLLGGGVGCTLCV